MPEIVDPRGNGTAVPGPAPVPRRVYRPPTIREASRRIQSWEDCRVHFYDWLDDFYHYPIELGIGAFIPPDKLPRRWRRSLHPRGGFRTSYLLQTG